MTWKKNRSTVSRRFPLARSRSVCVVIGKDSTALIFQGSA
jgi:hypothetical protein